MRWIRTSFFILDPKIIFAIWPKIKNFATAILLIILEHNRLDLHSLWNHYDWFEIDCNCFLQVSVTLVQPWPLWMTIFMPIKFKKRVEHIFCCRIFWESTSCWPTCQAVLQFGFDNFFEIIKIKRGIRTLFCQHENFIVSKMRKCGYFVLISYNRKPKSDFISVIP